MVLLPSQAFRSPLQSAGGLWCSGSSNSSGRNFLAIGYRVVMISFRPNIHFQFRGPVKFIRWDPQCECRTAGPPWSGLFECDVGTAIDDLVDSISGCDLIELLERINEWIRYIISPQSQAVIYWLGSKYTL